MNEKMLSHRLLEVTKTLIVIIKRLKKIGTKLDINRVQNWLNTLEQEPLKDDLNNLWSEIQHIGSRMNYIDYADSEFRELSYKLKDQMLDVIIELRQDLDTQKDEPN